MKRVIHFLLFPANRVMRALRLSNKLLLIAALTFVPLTLLAVQFLIEERASHRQAASEADGAQVVGAVMATIAAAQDYRAVGIAALAGDTQAKAAQAQQRAALLRAIEAYDAALATEARAEYKRLWQAARGAMTDLAGESGAASAQRANQAIEAARMYLLEIGDRSGLLLDPEAASYFLMDLAVQRIAPWGESVSRMHAQAGALLAQREPAAAEAALLRNARLALDGQLHEIEFVVTALQRAGERVPAEYQTAVQASQKLAQLMDAGLANGWASVNARALVDAGQAAVDANRAFGKVVTTRLQAMLDARESSIGNTILINVVGSVLGLSLLVALMYSFYVTVMGAIRRLSAAVKATSAGDLTAQAAIWGDDELAQIGQALDRMNVTLSGLVANIRSNSTMVARSGTSLVAGARDLSSRTEHQAASLEQTSASVQQLSSTVQNNADSAQAADSLANRVRGVVENAGATMHSAVDTMNGIQASARRVQDIIGVIDGIAFQTNILALNAAVEAARAGETGRGFAVVASEVRSLAQRSATAAHEIRDLIGASVAEADTGVARIGEVSRTLETIVNGMREVATNVRAISSASAEQSQGLAQISVAIGSLDDITQQNAQLVETTSRASEDLGLRANKLADAVAAFKLRQGTADEAFALVERAVALYKSRGRAALDQITREAATYADRDMYVFGIASNGHYCAFAGKPERVGIDLRTVPGLDGEKLIHDAFADTAQGGAWIDYQIVVPGTDRVEPKTSYMVQVAPDVVIGCGVYKYI